MTDGDREVANYERVVGDDTGRVDTSLV